MTARARGRAASRAGCELCDGARARRGLWCGAEEGILPGHALRGRRLCPLRARAHAAGGDRLVADRAVLARHHQGARLRHARAATTSSTRRRSPISEPRLTRRRATPDFALAYVEGACPHAGGARAGLPGAALQVRRALVAARRAAPRLCPGAAASRPAPSCRTTVEARRRHERSPDTMPARLPPWVRLHFDVRDAWVLLAPERVLFPCPTSLDDPRALRRRATLARSSAELAAEYDAPATSSCRDVRRHAGRSRGEGFSARREASS